LNYEGVDYEVTNIGKNAFEGCINPTSVIIPNSFTEIGKEAFQNCPGLVSVTIPSSVTSIGDNAFYYCSSLTNITIPNSVTSIGDYAFYYCSSLTSMIIPNSVNSIGNYTFYYCSGLSNVTIPKSVTSIGIFAFRGCSRLTSVTLSNSVTSIGDFAFLDCFGLKDVYCYAENVPTTSPNAFDSRISAMTLHVPASSLSSYQSKTPWSNFGTIVALDGETPVLEKCATPTIAFDNGRLTFDCETEDVEFKYSISMTGGQSNTGSEVLLPSLTPTYTLSVYAMKEGYEDSDVATYVVTYQAKKGDVNGDGEITISDAVGIVDIILGNNSSGN